jgi:hypothetical protein
MAIDPAVQRAAEAAVPLHVPDELGPLLDRIGEARFVLIGEAPHGTAEYYRWRAELSRRLIAERGFSFVAVEGDWPDCYRVNCWLRDRDGRQSAEEVLATFDRWPTWMWANEEVAEFATWLREHNRTTIAAAPMLRTVRRGPAALRTRTADVALRLRGRGRRVAERPPSAHRAAGRRRRPRLRRAPEQRGDRRS